MGEQETSETRDVITMMFYGATQQYQVERIRSAAEQRRADAELGMLAAGVSRRWRRIVRALAGPLGGRSGTIGG
jgi:hypothetical protein